jgi:hypothetical protein
MTTRERLRVIADRLDALAKCEVFDGGCMPEDAAALRALADKLDAETVAASRMMESGDATRQRRYQAATDLDLLTRLDAPADPALQKEPR